MEKRLCPECGDPLDFVQDDSLGRPVCECSNLNHKDALWYRFEGDGLVLLTLGERQQIEKSRRLPKGFIVPELEPKETEERLSVNEEKVIAERLLDPAISKTAERLVPYIRATLRIERRIAPLGFHQNCPRVFDALNEWNIESNTGISWEQVEFFVRMMGKSVVEISEEKVMFKTNETDKKGYPTVCRNLVLSEGFRAFLLSTDLFKTKMEDPSTIQDYIRSYLTSCMKRGEDPLHTLEQEFPDARWRWWVNWFLVHQTEKEWEIGVHPPLYVVNEFYFDSEKRPKKGCYSWKDEREDTEDLWAFDPLAQNTPSYDERRKIAKLLLESLSRDIDRMMTLEENLKRLRKEFINPESQAHDYDPDFLERMKREGLVIVSSEGRVVVSDGIQESTIKGEIEAHEDKIRSLVGGWLTSRAR